MQQELFENPRPEGLFKVKITEKELFIINTYLNQIIIKTPFYHQYTYHGSKINTKQTSIGKYGWISDEKGYRYEEKHPNGNIWIPISGTIYRILESICANLNVRVNVYDIDSCLINLYEDDSNLGMHYDNTEKDLTFPIISISSGCSAIFNIEGYKEILSHGDVLIMSGKSRNMKHGITGLLKSNVYSKRFNFTFRKAM